MFELHFIRGPKQVPSQNKGLTDTAHPEVSSLCSFTLCEELPGLAREKASGLEGNWRCTFGLRLPRSSRSVTFVKLVYSVMYFEANVIFRTFWNWNLVATFWDKGLKSINPSLHGSTSNFRINIRWHKRTRGIGNFTGRKVLIHPTTWRRTFTRWAFLHVKAHFLIIKIKGLFRDGKNFIPILFRNLISSPIVFKNFVKILKLWFLTSSMDVQNEILVEFWGLNGQSQETPKKRNCISQNF